MWGYQFFRMKFRLKASATFFISELSHLRGVNEMVSNGKSHKFIFPWSVNVMSNFIGLKSLDAFDYCPADWNQLTHRWCHENAHTQATILNLAWGKDSDRYRRLG